MQENKSVKWKENKYISLQQRVNKIGKLLQGNEGIIERIKKKIDCCFLPSKENMPVKSQTSTSSRGLSETRHHGPRRMNSSV